MGRSEARVWLSWDTCSLIDSGLAQSTFFIEGCSRPPQGVASDPSLSVSGHLVSSL